MRFYTFVQSGAYVRDESSHIVSCVVVLYCGMLWYVVLWCIVICHAVFCCVVPLVDWTMVCCVVFHHYVLCCTLLLCVVMCCIYNSAT